MGLQCNMTSAYHPKSNGLDERFNQTLQRQLLKYVGEKQNDWDLYLDAVLFSYRVSRQDSTKTSPFMLVYGRQQKLPVKYSINSTVDEEQEGGVNGEIRDDSGSTRRSEQEDGGLENGVAMVGVGDENRDMNCIQTNEQDDGGLEDRIKKMVTIRKKALENIKVAQERQKRQYDAEHSRDKAKYKIGTLILVKNSLKLSRKGSKLEPNWNISTFTTERWQGTGSAVQHETIEALLPVRFPTLCLRPVRLPTICLCPVRLPTLCLCPVRLPTFHPPNVMSVLQMVQCEKELFMQTDQ